MKRTFKITVMALLSAIMFLSPIHVFGLESDLWKSEAIRYPNEGQLVPAGPIEIEWNTLDNNVEKYNIYLDEKLIDSVIASDNEIMKSEIYTTEVSSHQVQVGGVLNDGSEIKSDVVDFYISKKGLAYNQVDQVANLNASWYYNWGISPTEGVNTSLEFVPMLWGAGNESANLTKIKNNGYHMVLGYNEPEGSLSNQSNVSVEKAVSRLQYFTESGLRVGSPAVEHLSSLLEENSWFDQFMKSIQPDDIDFIAVHEYYAYICSCENSENTKKYAKEFLQNLQKVYDQYQKPIWITELGIANWDPYWPHYSYESESGKKEVYEIMDYVMNGVDGVKGLNDLDFVERYAWFPFDMSSTTAGASSLFATNTDYQKDSKLVLGELTELGKLYRDSGNPSDYQGMNNIAYANVTFDKVEYSGQPLEPTATIYYENTLLKKDQDYKITYTQNINAGEGKAIIEGIGRYTGNLEKSFTISKKDISKVSISDIPVQRYTGNKVEPELILKDGTKDLEKNVDYTATYTNNILTGTNAKAVIISKGNYQGSKTLYFEIREYPITGVTLNKTSFTLTKGKTSSLKATLIPSYTTDDPSLYWTSSDTRVVTVNNGMVKAIAPGKAMIAVKTSNGKRATCTVTVPYIITYKLNYGTNSKYNPSSYYGTKITLKNPTRKGYTFAGWYTDSRFKTRITSFSSGNKTVYAKWTKVTVSKAKTPTLTNLSGRKLKITYSATSGAKGYQIQYATNSKFSKATTKTLTGRSATYTLTKGKTYYVRVRAYKIDSTGAKVYGSWSSVRSKKITR